AHGASGGEGGESRQAHRIPVHHHLHEPAQKARSVVEILPKCLARADRGREGLLMLRWAVIAAALAVLAGCADSNKIQGNETGGIVPPVSKSGAEAAAAAQDFCKQYNRTARITAKGNDAGGTTIFVCLAPGRQSPFER